MVNIFLIIFPHNFEHSAFTIKLRWREYIMMENANACLKSNDNGGMDSSSNNLDCDMDTEVMVLDDNTEGKVSFLCHR